MDKNIKHKYELIIILVVVSQLEWIRNGTCDL